MAAAPMLSICRDCRTLAASSLLRVSCDGCASEGGTRIIQWVRSLDSRCRSAARSRFHPLRRPIGMMRGPDPLGCCVRMRVPTSPHPTSPMRALRNRAGRLNLRPIRQGRPCEPLDGRGGRLQTPLRQRGRIQAPPLGWRSQARVERSAPPRAGSCRPLIARR